MVHFPRMAYFSYSNLGLAQPVHREHKGRGSHSNRARVVVKDLAHSIHCKIIRVEAE